MHEFFPLVAGVVIALALWSREISPRISAVALVVLSVIVGFLASWVSGELSQSWAYLAFDIAQVILVACMTTVLITVCRRRTTRSR